MNRTKIEYVDYQTGNRIIDTSGYVIVYCPDHPHAKPNGYVFEHRLIMERKLKRLLTSDEHIHHINGNRQDNNPENLELTTNSEHKKSHWKMASKEYKKSHLEKLHNGRRAQRIPRNMIYCSCGCGQQILDRNEYGRPKKYVHGHNNKGKTWKWGTK